jgi:hypothetical protein
MNRGRGRRQDRTRSIILAKLPISHTATENRSQPSICTVIGALVPSDLDLEPHNNDSVEIDSGISFVGGLSGAVHIVDGVRFFRPAFNRAPSGRPARR